MALQSQASPSPGKAELENAEEEDSPHARATDPFEGMRPPTPDPGEVSSLTAIEAFELDPDFDYDNVVLAPKYTLQEICQGLDTPVGVRVPPKPYVPDSQAPAPDAESEQLKRGKDEYEYDHDESDTNPAPL